MLGEEITEGEVEEYMLKPMKSVQAIMLFTLLFQEIPVIFTADIKQLAFNKEFSSECDFSGSKTGKSSI
jgi:hypothetical protein